MYLADTNIFLEILLQQAKSNICKKFLSENFIRICISDFSLHSIGVILFRYKAYDTYQKFITDLFPRVELVSLPANFYSSLPSQAEALKLDFDDAYQYQICKAHDLILVTMDEDFKRVRDLKSKFL